MFGKGLVCGFLEEHERAVFQKRRVTIGRVVTALALAGLVLSPLPLPCWACDPSSVGDESGEVRACSCCERGEGHEGDDRAMHAPSRGGPVGSSPTPMEGCASGCASTCCAGKPSCRPVGLLSLACFKLAESGELPRPQFARPSSVMLDRLLRPPIG